jgi:hypothetical protein
MIENEIIIWIGKTNWSLIFFAVKIFKTGNWEKRFGY